MSPPAGAIRTIRVVSSVEPVRGTEDRGPHGQASVMSRDHPDTGVIVRDSERIVTRRRGTSAGALLTELGRAGCTMLLVIAIGCDRPAGLAGERLAPAPALANTLTLGEFVPVVPWLWDGPTECLWVYDLTTEVGQRARTQGPLLQTNHPEAVYIMSLGAPTREKFHSSLWLEFDRTKRLIYYGESRPGVFYADTRGPWQSTSVTIGTDRGSVANYYHRPKSTPEVVYASADSIYHALHVSAPGRLVQLALERCGLRGKGFTSPFDRAP